MLNFLYTKDKFYKKIRSKFIRGGYTDTLLKTDIDKTLETLIKYNRGCNCYIMPSKDTFDII